MKDKLELLIRNSSAVCRRNTDVVRYLIFSLISLVLLKSTAVSSIIIWIVFFYNAVNLIWSLFLFALDMLDSVFNIRKLTNLRTRLYNKRIRNIIRKYRKSKEKKEFLMPYQSGSPFGVPSVMKSKMNDLQR